MRKKEPETYRVTCPVCFGRGRVEILKEPDQDFKIVSPLGLFEHFFSGGLTALMFPSIDACPICLGRKSILVVEKPRRPNEQK